MMNAGEASTFLPFRRPPSLLALLSVSGGPAAGTGARDQTPCGWQALAAGEWVSFAQIVAMLVFRYAINVVPVVAPVLHADPIWHWGSLLNSAVLSALFLGRTAARLRVYFAPHFRAA